MSSLQSTGAGEATGLPAGLADAFPSVKVTQAMPHPLPEATQNGTRGQDVSWLLGTQREGLKATASVERLLPGVSSAGSSWLCETLPISSSPLGESAAPT